MGKHCLFDEGQILAYRIFDTLSDDPLLIIHMGDECANLKAQSSNRSETASAIDDPKMSVLSSLDENWDLLTVLSDAFDQVGQRSIIVRQTVFELRLYNLIWFEFSQLKAPGQAAFDSTKGC